MLDISKFERMEDYRGDHTIFYFPHEKRNFNTYINVIPNLIRSSEFYTQSYRDNKTHNRKREIYQIYRCNNNKRSN